MCKLGKISTVYSLCFLLSACIGSTPPRPWFEGETAWPSVHRFEVTAEGKQQPFEFATKIHYVDASSTWIYLYVNDFKRGSTSISYSAKDAYIKKENGARITPTLYITSPNAEKISPGLPWAGKIPDIAVREQTVDPSNSGGMYGGVDLRFDTAPPEAGSRWILHLGKVTIGDMDVEIPERTIIVRARQWYTVPVQ